MHPVFIPVNEARQFIKDNSYALPATLIPLQDALHRVLADDVYSPINMPAFLQSSMDGYAFAFSDLATRATLRISGESFAGSGQTLSLDTGTAMRIFTGAPLPTNADTVVMQEQVTRTGDTISFDKTNLTPGTNARAIGSEISKGALAMQKGELLTPAAIGYLAGLGFTQVKAIAAPKVSIIATGKEIAAPGRPLHFGQVYESNSFTLKAALKQMQLQDVQTHFVDDILSHLEIVIGNALSSTQLVLITGGVSVGDYDLVPAALEKCGVETIFHKIKQRPGKPMFFGKKENTMVFGLPGNPSSVLSCFYQYVVPAIENMTGRTTPFFETRNLQMQASFSKQIPLTQFLKGRHSGNEVIHLGAQESFRLSSFAVANCLIEIPAETMQVEKGDWVKVLLI